MPSTFSPSLRIELIGAGEQSGVWGTTTNNNLGELIEQAIAGRTTVDVTAGNATLTSLNGVVDEARSAVLAVTGTPGVTRIITIPNAKKAYMLINQTTNIVQVKTASGTAFDCPPSATTVIACDGSNGVQGSGVAPLTSPAFTGVPIAPTAAGGTNTTQLATTAFVNAEIASDTANLAPIASPTFTGVPAAPTASVGTNTTQLATTAFVNNEIASDTANLAPLASPALTGVPTAPTAAVGTNTTQLATTAFVNDEIANDAPTKTGTGASGTWGISITGNAATATNATNVAVTTSSAASAFKVPFANTTISTTGNYGLLQDSTATFTYNPSTNTLTAGTFSGDLSGNATTAATLQTARTIGGVSFDGSVNINLPGVNTAGNQNTTGNAATATNASQLGGVAAASYALLSGTQTFTGAKTFTGNIFSQAYNFAATTSFFLDGGGGIQLAINGNIRFKVDTSGDLEIGGSNATKASGTTWINPSDARLKDNVVSYTKGLNELVQIQPKSFTFNGKAGSVAGLNAIGIIADEIEQVLPNTVQKRLAKLNPNDAQETEIRYFDASELTWVMVNAIKELKAEFDAYKATHP